MKHSLFKRIDKETTCWDLDAGCRRYISNNKRTRAFRKEMRRHARKRINNFIIKEGI